MNRRWVIGILVGLLLLAGGVALAGYAYSAGVAQGLVQSGQFAGPEGAPGPFYFYGRPWGPGFGFGPFGFGFGLLRCLVPLLFFVLLFSLLRAFFWRGPWGWGRGWAGPGGAPPAFDEWHRRAHGEPGGAGQPPAAGGAPQA